MKPTDQLVSTTPAFLPPPPFFRQTSSKPCLHPSRPRRRARLTAKTSLDDDFFISSDDLNFSLPESNTKKDTGLSVAHRRTESKRLELARAADLGQTDDDEFHRNQVAGEQLSVSDLFGIAPSNKPESSNPNSKPAQTTPTKPRQPATASKQNPAANQNPTATQNGTANRKSKRQLQQKLPQQQERLPPLKRVNDTLQPGDLINHARHGIGRFRGLERTKSSANPVYSGDSSPRVVQEYAVIEYRDGDVYVPLSHLEVIKKLSESEAAHIDRLDPVSGATNYPGNAPRKSRATYQARQKTRARIRKQLVNLHGLYAKRTTVERDPFPVDELAEERFARKCGFELTSDQEVAIEQVLGDLSTKRNPMDRLLCGDVGFGKTEVAIRAAFRVLKAGKQVAILAPTTILAQQHFETFRQRFEKHYPEYPIASLTRFVPRKTVVASKQAIEKGQVQIAIGTHMMLNDRLTFNNLGMLIIDEEHRFGVNQKEKLRERYRSVDTLFLSATPIPRTLHLTLSGLRDASVLRSPPRGRKRVITKVSPNGTGVVRQAISKEIERGGQVFFVVPRIEGIEAAANWIEDLFPSLRVLVAHGAIQQLEKRIWAFARREYDVLVCTTIIENGINMPEVNTIVVMDAYRFGLAQLHQLRGRVGRSDVQAYAWMLYTEQAGMQGHPAIERLQVLEKFSDLGSGFAIAQRDMEMRGVGTILGVEQHGNTSVGAEEYARMLAEELDFARTGKPVPVRLPITDSVEIFLPVASLIPEEYISDFEQKMTAYGLLSSAKTMKKLRQVAADLELRYGPLPSATRRHVSVLELKLFAKDLGIKRIAAERQHVTMDWALDEAAFKLLITFLPDKQSRSRCEHLVSDERFVLRGLGVCSGDVQLAKLRVVLNAFCKAAVGLRRQGNAVASEIKLAESLYGVSTGDL